VPRTRRPETTSGSARGTRAGAKASASPSGDSDRLGPYRGKRTATKTPEPVPESGPLPVGNDDTFVIQEHHARALHWDFRLEHDGVLVSWALPKGLPSDPKRNHLAVHTEDHPLEYASFAGAIPAGEYGAGTVEIWDRGTYEVEKWAEDEVKVVLHGERADGAFVLIHTGDKNWLIHRMTRDPSPSLDLVRPMLATPSALPERDADYAYETKFDGVRAIGYLLGGKLRLVSRNDADVTAAYPELADLATTLPVDAIVDGEIVAFDAAGRISFAALQPRMHLRDARQVARLAERSPVTYQIFDLLYLDGNSTVDLPYRQRREVLEGLGLGGARWAVPPYTVGGGAELLRASREQKTEGIMAKRLDSRYQPGRRSPAWLKIKNFATQEVVIAGWTPGRGNRSGTIGALLLGIPGPDGLEYAGAVGTGFTREILDELMSELGPRARRTPALVGELPARDVRDAHWVTPALVGEVAFAEWTRDGRLRQPSWRGLRPDKSPGEVIRES
jgi:bifunctional non-homologous end joining protein LigD